MPCWDRENFQFVVAPWISDCRTLGAHPTDPDDVQFPPDVESVISLARLTLVFEVNCYHYNSYDEYQIGFQRLGTTNFIAFFRIPVKIDPAVRKQNSLLRLALIERSDFDQSPWNVGISNGNCLRLLPKRIGSFESPGKRVVDGSTEDCWMRESGDCEDVSRLICWWPEADYFGHFTVGRSKIYHFSRLTTANFGQRSHSSGDDYLDYSDFPEFAFLKRPGPTSQTKWRSWLAFNAQRTIGFGLIENRQAKRT